MGIGGGEFEAEHDLRENGGRRQAAQHLIKVAHGDGTSGLGVGRAAFQFGAGAGVIFCESLAGGGSDFFQAARKKFFSHIRKVVVPLQLPGKRRSSAAVGGVHELHVLRVFAGGTVDDGSDGLGGVVMGRRAELFEAGEEMIVA
jgi:hypothetical protein